MIPTLWNGAVLGNDKTIDLLLDVEKLQSYLDNALIPMVRELKDHPALGAWDIMNEPEGTADWLHALFLPPMIKTLFNVLLLD